MKIGAFLLTATANLGIGIVLFFFLIIALNGYSESQATPGLILFIVWILIFSLIMAILSFFMVGYFGKKSMNKLAAMILSVVVFSLAGTVVDFVGMLAAVGLIEALR